MSCVHGERTTCPLLFSIAYGMTGSVSDAEDIVQEAFGRAGPGPSQGNPGERAEGVPCDDGHPTGCVVNPDKLRRLGGVSELARKPPPKTRQPFIPARIARSPRRDQARGHAAR